MKYTNNFNLPKEIVHTIVNDDYDHPTDEKTIPVHDLIAPTRIAVLSGRHDDEIIKDVSEDIWKLFGQSIHYILSRQKPEGKLIEERIKIQFKDYVVSGKPDNFDIESGHLQDYKVTSVWTYIYGSKDGRKEWEDQLNLYAWLLRSAGRVVKQVSITALLRDWSQRDASKSSSYPQIPLQTLEMPLWSFQEQEKYIEDKIKLFEQNMPFPDNDLALCTPNERWASPTTWAVMKEGNKKASKVETTEEEANKWIQEQGNGKKFSIEVRKGEDKRCTRYCNVNRWCNYYKGEYCENRD